MNDDPGTQMASKANEIRLLTFSLSRILETWSGNLPLDRGYTE
jgi:hypothetical protein